MLRRTLCFSSLRAGPPTATDRGNVASRFGYIDTARVPGQTRTALQKIKLENQKHIRKEMREMSPSEQRKRQFVICQKCGVLNMVINFDKIPSARVGMFGLCTDGADFTHHKFAVISGDQYRMLQEKDIRDRLDWFWSR